MPVELPTSWKALQSLKGFLQLIQVQNGFYTDAGKNVQDEPFQQKADESESDDFPSIHFAQDDDDTVYEGNKLRENDCNIVIEAYINVQEDDAQLKAHMIRSDILKAIPKKNKGWPGFVSEVKLKNRKIVQRPFGLPLIAVQVSLTLTLIEQ